MVSTDLNLASFEKNSCQRVLDGEQDGELELEPEKKSTEELARLAGELQTIVRSRFGTK